MPVVRVGIRDTFTETGPYERLMDDFGMSVDDIVSAAGRAISLKRVGKGATGGGDG